MGAFISLFLLNVYVSTTTAKYYYVYCIIWIKSIACVDKKNIIYYFGTLGLTSKRNDIFREHDKWECLLSFYHIKWNAFIGNNVWNKHKRELRNAWYDDVSWGVIQKYNNKKLCNDISSSITTILDMLKINHFHLFWW